MNDVLKRMSVTMPSLWATSTLAVRVIPKEPQKSQKGNPKG